MKESPQKASNEKEQEYQDLLIKCISQDLGFAKGRPVAACIIYKCLRHWGSFEVEKTTIFDRIIQTISHAIEVYRLLNYAFCHDTLFICQYHVLIEI